MSVTSSLTCGTVENSCSTPEIFTALHDAAGRYEQAEPLYQQALEIRRQVLGEQHPDFAPSLGNLAGLYSETGRSEQAEPLYQQALEVFRQVLGPNHPHTKLVQANYDRARRAR